MVWSRVHSQQNPVRGFVVFKQHPIKRLTLNIKEHIINILTKKGSEYE